MVCNCLRIREINNRAENKRIFICKDKDQTGETKTHNKEHEIAKLIRTKKQKEMSNPDPQKKTTKKQKSKKLGAWTRCTGEVHLVGLCHA